jgi:hypothetical protein
MLYLFNSAYRPKYSGNVLNTFFLASGWINEYRYSRTNVDPKIISAKSPLAEKQAMVVFIDRFHERGFFLHPIRMATYVEHEVRGDQVYFRATLGDFIYPRNIENFQEIFYSSFNAEQLPHPITADADSKAGGHFALCGKNITTIQYMEGEDAWVRAVDTIGKIKPFAGKRVVFVRESVRKQDGKRRQVNPKNSGKTSYYPLIRGKRYILQLYYRFPQQDTDHEAAAALLLRTPNLMLPLSSTLINVNSRNSTEYVDFAVKDFPEDKDGIVFLEPRPEERTENADSETILLPTSSITVHARKPLSFWFLTAALLLAYAILGVCAGTDFDRLLTPLNAAKQLTVTQATEKALLAFAQNNWLFLKVSAVFLQALALLGLFRLLGQKLL